MLLKDKVALVVGIKNEIGSVTAEIMAQAGAKVVIADRNPVRGQAMMQKIVAAGGEAIFQETDITLVRYQRILINRIVENYGQLNIVFNNVSVEGDRFPLAQQSEDMVAGVIDVNFNGMWLSLKHQIAQMLKNGGGAIVNNVCNFKTDGSPGCSVYRATKSAVLTMSQVAALEYARNNIRINAISTGLMENQFKLGNGRLPFGYAMPTAAKSSTAMPSAAKSSTASQAQAQTQARSQIDPAFIPMNRCGSPQEIAETVVWLCSDKASYITGHTLSVDGGLAALGMQ
jgi:NAD(P)-dependent dehydrogenase (short-subunit alcohol dehydrogenase family)